MSTMESAGCGQEQLAQIRRLMARRGVPQLPHSQVVSLWSVVLHTLPTQSGGQPLERGASHSSVPPSGAPEVVEGLPKSN